MMLMVKARHSQHIVFYKNFFYCPIEGPQGAKSLQWYIIMRCRKGIFELENIVNMATFPTSDTILRHYNTTYEYVNSGSSYLIDHTLFEYCNNPSA